MEGGGGRGNEWRGCDGWVVGLRMSVCTYEMGGMGYVGVAQSIL